MADVDRIQLVIADCPDKRDDGWIGTEIHRDIFRELARISTVTLDPKGQAEPSVTATQRFVFRKGEGNWTLRFHRGETIHPPVVGRLGLEYVHILVQRSGEDIDVTELLHAAHGKAPVVSAAKPEDLADREAHQRLQRKYDENRALEAAADKAGNTTERDMARRELVDLAVELKALRGFAGRSRTFPTQSGRYADNVRKSIKYALMKLPDAIQQHFLSSVTTGLRLRYSPESPIDWSL